MKHAPRVRLGAAAAVLALFGASACSSSSSPMACNSLVDDAATVTATEVAAAAPTPAGGMIADGTYALTALTEYTGPGGATGNLAMSGSVVMAIAGTTMQQAGQLNGQENRYTTTITTSGTMITTMDTCPASASATHLYTATPTALRIYDTNSGLTLEQTYTRR
jgi:hypothetical protein